MDLEATHDQMGLENRFPSIRALPSPGYMLGKGRVSLVE